MIHKYFHRSLIASAILYIIEQYFLAISTHKIMSSAKMYAYGHKESTYVFTYKWNNNSTNMHDDVILNIILNIACKIYYI